MTSIAITFEEVVSVTIVEGGSPGLAVDVGTVIVGPEVPVAVVATLGIFRPCHHVPRSNAEKQKKANRNSAENLHAGPLSLGG